MTIFAPAVYEGSAPRFLAGGGEMGALMRAHDWSSSALGDPALWPQTLRTMVCLLLNTHHPVYIFWGDEALCFYNDAYRRSLGPERHPGSLGRPAREVWAEIWDVIGSQIEQVMTGGGATWRENELIVTTRNGRREDVYWTYGCSPINHESAASGVGGVLVVCTETTTAVKAQLLDTRRMETLGRLTGGIAHDFNNLLTPIMSGLDVLTDKLAGDANAQRAAAAAMHSAERAKDLVQRLLAFGRRQTLQNSTVALAAMIGSMEHQIRRTLGPAVELVVDIPEDIPKIEIDAAQIGVGISNIIANARDAMPKGGQLTISARYESAGPSDADHLVSLRITDTGEGMDPETLQRAIEPFFTTRRVGEGAGLGLSMVDGLAAQMGGKFVLTSASGSGTTAELLLPVAEAPPNSAAAVPKNLQLVTEHACSARTVLLVDDEELVRMTIADDLMDLGYIVVEASSGAGALALLSEGLCPDMLMTDYAMPGMTGAALVRAARLGLPALPVLMVTGFAHLKSDETREFEVLAKPFRKMDMAVRLSAMFASAA